MSRAPAARPSLAAAKVAAFRLERHHLHARAPAGSAEEVVRCICGLHAQVMSSADLSLWARVRGHAPNDLSRALWEERTLVKTWLMRGTLHVVPADDLPLYVSALDTRGRYSGAWLRAFEVTADDVERLIDAIADALDGRRLERRELVADVTARLGKQFRRWLESGWGEFLKPAARRGVLCHGPSDGQNVTFVRPDQWLGRWREVPQAEAEAELLRRYLRAYGPASREDFDRWIGARGARFRSAWAAVGDQLVEVAPNRFLLAEDRERFERVRASRRVSLLPSFDPFLLGHDDRTFLVDDVFKARVYRAAGWVSPVVLVGGRIVAVWAQERRGRLLRMAVDAFEPMDERVRREVAAEAEALAASAGADVELAFT